MARNEISITNRVIDEASPALNAAAQAALQAAAAHKKASDETAAAGDKQAEAQGRVLSAAQQVTQAVQAQAAAGKPLQAALVALRSASQEVEAQLRAQAKAGEALDQETVKLAADLRTAISETQAQIRAEKDGAEASGQLSDAFAEQAAAALTIGGAIALATKAYEVLIANTIELGDELDGTAQKLGLSVEALQELRYAADGGNVEASELDAALAKLNNQIGEAMLGSGKAADTFEDLGIAIRGVDGQARPTDDVLRQIADKLAATTDQAERTRIAVDLFGKSGADLLPVLQNGGAALDEMREAARKLGVMSSETAAKAGEADQAINDLAQASRSLVLVLSQDFVPWATRTADTLTAIVTATRDAAPWIAGVGQAFAGNSKPLADLIALQIKGTTAAAGEDQVSAVLAETLQMLTRVRESAALPMPELIAITDASTRARDREAAAALRQAEAAERAAAARAKAIEAELLGGLPEPDTSGANASGAAAAALDAQEKETNARIDRYVQLRETLRRRDLASQEQVDAARVASGTKADETLEKSAISAAEAGASALGAALGEIATGTVKAEKAFLKFGQAAVKIAIQAGQQIIAQQIQQTATKVSASAAEGGTAAIAAHAGIPFVGLQIGLATAGAIVAAIFAAAGAQGFASGGIVTGGTPGADSVPAMLTPGEAVLPVAVVRRLRGLLGELGTEQSAPVALGSAMAFAGGGVAPQAQAAAPSITVNFSSQQIPAREEWDRFVRDHVAPSLKRLAWQGGG